MLPWMTFPLNEISWTWPLVVPSEDSWTVKASVRLAPWPPTNVNEPVATVRAGDPALTGDAASAKTSTPRSPVNPSSLRISAPHFSPAKLVVAVDRFRGTITGPAASRADGFPRLMGGLGLSLGLA